jgi:hypothetical protein
MSLKGITHAPADAPPMSIDTSSDTDVQKSKHAGGAVHAWLASRPQPAGALKLPARKALAKLQAAGLEQAGALPDVAQTIATRVWCQVRDGKTKLLRTPSTTALASATRRASRGLIRLGPPQADAE